MFFQENKMPSNSRTVEGKVRTYLPVGEAQTTKPPSDAKTIISIISSCFHDSISASPHNNNNIVIEDNAEHGSRFA